jgi:hypothetical protein
VDLVNGKDSRQVVDTGVKTDLVHDSDTSLLGGGIELHHGGRDVGGCDDILLLADGRLDDGGVECVGDQADDNVNLGDFSVEGLVVVDIELRKLVLQVNCSAEVSYADSCRVGYALGQSLCLLESPASDNDLDTRLSEDLCGRSGNESCTKQKNRPGTVSFVAQRSSVYTHFPVVLAAPMTLSNLSGLLSNCPLDQKRN